MFDAKTNGITITIPQQEDLEQLQAQVDAIPVMEIPANKKIRIASSNASAFTGDRNYFEIQLEVDDTHNNLLGISAGNSNLYFRYSTDGGSSWTNIWQIRKTS